MVNAREETIERETGNALVQISRIGIGIASRVGLA
jgi:hypothetical protein